MVVIKNNSMKYFLKDKLTLEKREMTLDANETQKAADRSVQF